MKTTLEILQGTRQLLSDRTKWLKGNLAADIHGNPCAPHEPQAAKFCIMGGVITQTDPQLWQGMDETTQALRDQVLLINPNAFDSFSGLGGWNDKPETTHELILEILDKAITYEEGLRSTK